MYKKMLDTIVEYTNTINKITEHMNKVISEVKDVVVCTRNNIDINGIYYIQLHVDHTEDFMKIAKSVGAEVEQHNLDDEYNQLSFIYHDMKFLCLVACDN